MKYFFFLSSDEWLIILVLLISFFVSNSLWMMATFRAATNCHNKVESDETESSSYIQHAHARTHTRAQAQTHVRQPAVNFPLN